MSKIFDRHFRQHYKYMIFSYTEKRFPKINFFRRLIYLLCQGLDFAKNGDIFSKKYRRSQNFFLYIVKLLDIGLLITDRLIVFNIGNSAVKLLLLFVQESEALQLPCTRYTVFHFNDDTFVRHVVIAIW